MWFSCLSWAVFYFFAFVFFFFFPLSFLVARVLNTWRSSLVVSMSCRFSKWEIALAPCYIFGQIVSITTWQDKYIKMRWLRKKRDTYIDDSGLHLSSDGCQATGLAHTYPIEWFPFLMGDKMPWGWARRIVQLVKRWPQKFENLR